MDVVIKLPDRKFKVGDFVKYTKLDAECLSIVGHVANFEPLEGIHIIARIHAVAGGGEWRIEPEYLDPIVEVDQYDYYMTAQEGCLNGQGSKIRPGTFLMANVENLDTNAEKVDYQGKVYSPDTPKNITQRVEDWKKSNDS